MRRYRKKTAPVAPGADTYASVDGDLQSQTSQAKAPAQVVRDRGPGRLYDRPILNAVVPAYFFRDPRASVSHFRGFCAIASFDCMSNQRKSGRLGNGCFASNMTLGIVADLHPSTMSA